MKIATVVVAAALLIGGTSALLLADAPAAPAAGAKGGNFAKTHPRRHQVNKRLKKQNARINAKEKEGKMSPGEAARLKKNDKDIHQEEKDMAAQDNGHITKQDQATLNQQLDQNSQAIKNH
jgi:hypothetical protein